MHFIVMMNAIAKITINFINTIRVIEKLHRLL